MPPKSKQQEAREHAAKLARDEAAAKRARAAPKLRQMEQAAAQAKQEREAAAALALVADERGDELRKAAVDGDVDAIAAMLAKTGADRYTVDNRNDDGLTALMKAAMYGQAEVIKLLLKHDANVELHDERGRTALMLASHNGEVAAIRALLAGGAKPAGAGELAGRSGASDDGRTALMLAAHSGHAEAVSLLLEAGAPFRDVDRNGMSALDLAHANSHADVDMALTAAILDAHAAATASSALKAPTAWGKVRKLMATIAFHRISHVFRPLLTPSVPFSHLPFLAFSQVRKLKAAAHASEAFAADDGREGAERKGLLASLLSGESTMGASTLSWLKALVKNSSDASRSFTRSLTRGFQGAGRSFKHSSTSAASSKSATVLDTAGDTVCV